MTNDVPPHAVPPNAVPPHALPPRVLVLSATPINGSWATSHLMADLFADWPDGSVAQVTIERDGSVRADQPIDSCYLALAGQHNPLRLVHELRRMRAFITAHDPQVVYFRSAGWPTVLELIPLLIRQPVVTHVMDDWVEALRVTHPRRAWLLDRVLTQQLRRSAGCLAISGSMADAFHERYDVACGVVHAATDRTPAAVTSPASGSSTDDRIVFYSGNVARNQTALALGDVAEAVRQLQDAGAGVQLVVAPSSPLPAELERRLNEAGASVVEQGSHGEYLERLAQASIVLATSNFDAESVAFLRYSLPNKIPDLLASGTPILVYGPTSLAYVVEAERAGWAVVVSSQDVAALAASITQLLDDSQVRARVTEAAATACTSTFAASTMHAKFRTALTQSMGRST